jgi:hypothetical protein
VGTPFPSRALVAALVLVVAVLVLDPGTGSGWLRPLLRACRPGAWLTIG